MTDHKEELKAHYLAAMHAMPTQGRGSGNKERKLAGDGKLDDHLVYSIPWEPSTFVGIDPGLHGAIAILSEGEVKIFDTPIVPVKVGKSARNQYVAQGMVEILAELDRTSAVVALESVHSMKGQGVASMFSFGRGFGLWEGILASLKLPYQLVSPQRWMRALGVNSDKRARQLVAISLYPDSYDSLKGSKAEGRVDALLLAHYRAVLVSHHEYPE